MDEPRKYRLTHEESDFHKEQKFNLRLEPLFYYPTERKKKKKQLATSILQC